MIKKMLLKCLFVPQNVKVITLPVIVVVWKVSCIHSEHNMCRMKHEKYVLEVLYAYI